MRYSRHLDVQQFLKELNDLRILAHPPSEAVLERLERQRILMPKQRLRYPDPVERRWYASERPGHRRPRPIGPMEPNGPRWKAACALEKARQDVDWLCKRDPLNQTNPLESRSKEWRQFIQFPARRKFVPWADFRVRVDGKRGGTHWHSRTAITYYSSWQLLLFIECHDMGTNYLGNTENWDWGTGIIPESWSGGGIRFEPIRSLASFRKFKKILDAIVWFTEESEKNANFILMQDNSNQRRLINDDEHAEIERRNFELARRCRKSFGVSYQKLIETIKFLCKRWGDWEKTNYQNHMKAYKSFIGRSVTLARYLKDVTPNCLYEDVGRVTGHFKPTLRVIFQDWASEWREDAAVIIEGFSRPDAILKADFTNDQANAFLDFIEENDLFEFYWRWKSLNERAFSGDPRRLAAVKSDLQGMALSVEHIVATLLKGNVLHPETQLFEKFKQIWPASSPVRKILKTNEYYQIAHLKKIVDLEWYNLKQGGSVHEQIASDLTICHAIRGNAHYRITEQNQLIIERMSLILLRGVVRAFLEARGRWPNTT